MAAVEPVSDAQDCRESLDCSPQRFVESAVIDVLPLRLGAAMIARHIGDDDLLRRRHPQQLAVLDEMERMLVVLVVTDVIADVVE